MILLAKVEVIAQPFLLRFTAVIRSRAVPQTDLELYTVATLVFPGTFCAIVQAILILSGNKVAIW
jgi:hypothetical protein